MKQNQKNNEELARYLQGEHNKRLLVIEPSDTLVYVDVVNDKVSLEEYQRLVDGYIEVYPSNDEHYIYLVDEEGLLKGRDFNELAFELLGIEAVGPVVVVPKEYFD